MRESIRILHEKAVQLSKTYLCAESELIELLMKLNQEHGYRDLDAKDLNEYARTQLGLSEDPANTLCRLARKSARFPGLLERIRSGELSITNARLICPVLTEENQEKWLSAATHLSKRALELALASEYPERAVTEILKPVSEKLWRLQLGLNPGQKEKLERAQDLESSRVSRAATLAETLEASLEAYLDRYDPIRKALRAQKRRERRKGKAQKARGPASSSPSRDGRTKLAAAVRQETALRDGDRCAYRYEDGSRCESRRWLDFHHRIPLAQGGPDTADNLLQACAAHHALIHFQMEREGSPSRDGQ